jgi:hypothetical protein
LSISNDALNIYKNIVRWNCKKPSDLDSSGSEEGLMVGFYEHSNEPSDSINIPLTSQEKDYSMELVTRLRN